MDSSASLKTEDILVKIDVGDMTFLPEVISSAPNNFVDMMFTNWWQKPLFFFYKEALRRCYSTLLVVQDKKEYVVSLNV